MWLLITFFSAVIASVFSIRYCGRLNLKFLSLMLWGATIMILVDHILGYEGGQFFETTTEGLVNNSSVLGILMLIPVILVWLGSLIMKRYTYQK